MLDSSVGSGQFRTSWECSTHHFAWSSSFVSVFPCLSFTWFAFTFLVPHSCLVILYTVLISPRIAVVSRTFLHLYLLSYSLTAVSLAIFVILYSVVFVSLSFFPLYFAMYLQLTICCVSLFENLSFLQFGCTLL